MDKMRPFGGVFIKSSLINLRFAQMQGCVFVQRSIALVFSKWGNKINFPVGNSEGDFLKLNIAQKRNTEFVQSYKNKKVVQLGFFFALSQWV